MNKTHSPCRISMPYEKGRLTVFRCGSAADVDNQPDVEPWALALASLPPLQNGVLLTSRYTMTVLQRLQVEYGRDAFLMTFRSLVVDMEHGLRPNNPVGMFIGRLRALGCDGGGFKVQEG